MRQKTLPWAQDEYVKLTSEDFDPAPPTPERRLRVAAALATLARDYRMTGSAAADEAVSINFETIRAILVMDNKSWAKDVPVLSGFLRAYDGVDPRTRYEQVSRRPV